MNLIINKLNLILDDSYKKHTQFNHTVEQISNSIGEISLYNKNLKEFCDKIVENKPEAKVKKKKEKKR